METDPLRIVVYHCRNLQFFQDGLQRTFVRSVPGLSLVSVPCSGKLEAHHLLKTLASGAEGVLVLACAESACQYVEGSMRSRKRVDYARIWLEKLGFEAGRIRFVRVPPMDVDALSKAINEFSSGLAAFDTIPALGKAQAS
jgi:F420-non-reducing hydrogenase iron-sulfur subunit